MFRAPPDSVWQREELLCLFGEFLNALSDPDAGEALYRMHAASAAVRCAETIRPAAEVDPTSFACTHREISLRGQDGLPKFGLPALLSAIQYSNGGEMVVWFGVAEAREHHRLFVAVGLTTQLGTPRIGWCTLAARVEPWSYRDGLLQSLSDYSWMRSGPTPSRVLLDASFFRQHWRAPVVFSTLPNARFSCQMSGVCCKHDFEISLPPEAQLLIDAMPWQTLQPQLTGTKLPTREDGKLQLKGLNESCRFLGAHRQCLIHQTLGRQPFGPCAVFPFAFAQTPEGIAVSQSPICGSSRLGLGVAVRDREADLRERVSLVEPRRATSFRLAPSTEISWESFRDIENGLLNCLTADDYPMRQRLYVGTRLLGALKHNEPIDTGRWLTERPVEISEELREAIRGMLSKILAWDRAALRTLPPALPEDLHKLEVCDSPVVVRILQNALFSKVYSYPYDLTTAYNFLIVLYLLTLIAQHASNGPLSDVMWQELGGLGVHGLLSNVLHDGVPEGFRTVFGSSEFGQWALAV